MTEPLPECIVYKVFAPAEAAAYLSGGRFDGSADDTRDGFIHLSTGEQLAGTLDRHYRGKLMLFLGFLAADRLGDKLAMELSRSGAMFPHLYRPLVVGDLVALVPIPDERQQWKPPILVA